MAFTTIVSRSSSSLLRHLSKTTPDPNAILLFALSANASNLEAIISRLRLLAPQTIGCLSSSLPGSEESVICSTAKFPSKSCVPFRSEIPGRPPVQVGRWNRVPDNSVEKALPDLTGNSGNWSSKDLWGAETGREPQLPMALRDHRDIKSLVFLSDDAPEGFARSLNAIPHADKLGLVASSTPFITGRPFTLFHNEHIYSSGAVGLALLDHPGPTPITYFHGLIPLSTPMVVSKSEGNLIHELNQSNPSKMLVEAISARPQFQIAGKDEDFYIGHFNYGSTSKDKLRRVYHILSGDPSRGSIALDAERAPEVGETVQFFFRAPEDPSTLKLQPEGRRSIRFLCSSYDPGSSHDPYGNDDEAVQVFSNTFFATSENGFLCTETASLSRLLWKCSVPHSEGSLSWTTC